VVIFRERPKPREHWKCRRNGCDEQAQKCSRSFSERIVIGVPFTGCKGQPMLGFNNFRQCGLFNVHHVCTLSSNLLNADRHGSLPCQWCIRAAGVVDSTRSFHFRESGELFRGDAGVECGRLGSIECISATSQLVLGGAWSCPRASRGRGAGSAIIIPQPLRIPQFRRRPSAPPPTAFPASRRRESPAFHPSSKAKPLPSSRPAPSP
jgi:hypothetical protein